jgi:beta-lactamase superfamily II metal-dependent hydrolase
VTEVRVHFLDVGNREYGDAVLCQFGDRSVLIDGAHPGDQVGSANHASIPEQLKTLLPGGDAPVRVDLLVVTHAHQDHIGCLPFLVAHGVLAADWALVADPGLGWGRSQDVAGPNDARVHKVVAALREEPQSSGTDDRTMEQFMADAASLEQTYARMLKTLADAGTKIVRHGRDDPAELLAAFSDLGLEILGPSDAQLLLCAQAIADRTDAAERVVSDMVTGADAATSDVDIYRDLLQRPDDAEDKVDRPGPAINLQSTVTRFEVGDTKLLFAGDMQFANPQLGDPALRAEVTALRARIQAEAPFSLVKLSHHGSDNAFDAELLAQLGSTPLYGICAGEDSKSHPNAKVLRLLDAERDHLQWLRTDHNGLSTVSFGADTELSLSKGTVNDPVPNTPDTQAPAQPQVPARVEVRTVAAGAGEPVEVVTRIPPGVQRVTLTIDVARVAVAPAALDAAPLGELTLAGGRKLPPLLFVTSRDALVANVGALEAERALGAIRDAGMPLYDSLPAGAADPAGAIALVREQVRARANELRGVVLVGGYDVVPAQRLDCLPAQLRSRLGQTDDADDFIVWSDDGYADLDADHIPELPVSRIPDGRSPELLAAALAAADSRRAPSRRGVRNVERPFAEDIYTLLQGGDALMVSEPTTFEQAPALEADLVYLMLHGDYEDSSRFWGENTANDVEAVNLTNIPRPGARVVFTGCCWGALTVDQPALRSLPGSVPAPKVSTSSIALRFLECGATAFVGCTGAHYSPTEAPYGYFGGPMHEAFWQGLGTGRAPAQALFDAKVEYVRGFPHGRDSDTQQAIEYKILRQYTCLGLGW